MNRLEPHFRYARHLCFFIIDSEISKMARLRFPGRPGYRFDRLGVRYGVDEGQRGLDPTTRLIANIHRGLRFFREHFGESDEVNHLSFFKCGVRRSKIVCF